MRDERVAELMKQSVAGKQPREHWEQQVLAAIDREQPVLTVGLRTRPFSLWWLWLVVGMPLIMCGMGYYLWSSHEQEKSMLLYQKQAAERAQVLAEQQAKELQQQIASIEAEQSQLEAQLAQAKTQAERIKIQRTMSANRARVSSLKSGNIRGAKVIIGGDSADPLQGIK